MATDRENRVAGTDQYERDSSVSASLVLPYHPFSRSFSLARVQERSLSLPLSLVSPLRTRDLFLRLQFQGNPLSRPSSTPLSARENTHARTRDTRKRSKSFLLSKRNSKAAAEEKGVKKLEGKWQSERRWEWRRGKVAWKKKDYVESTQEAKGENENVSRNSQGTCSETSLKDVLLRVQHLCISSTEMFSWFNSSLPFFHYLYRIHLFIDTRESTRHTSTQ